MRVKKDEYRAKQVGIMLKHETNPEETHYAAKLSHWYGDSKDINIEADALGLLQRAFDGEYVEVNEPEDTKTHKKHLFWCNYQYEEDNYPLLFIHLPHLNNRDIVQILGIWDAAYGDTWQETTDWALEYQVLTRMLVHEKSLLVNPRHLDISEDPFAGELLAALPTDDRIEYVEARKLSQEEILKMYQAHEAE